MVGSEHTGWTALLDRIGELLVDSNADDVERVCRNRVDVAAAKARTDGEGNWFAPTSMFTRNSFDTWAHLDPTGIGRKPTRGGQRTGAGAIGSATPRTDHGVEMKPAKEVM